MQEEHLLKASCRRPGVDPELFFSPDPPDGVGRPPGWWYSQLTERELLAKVRYCDECPIWAECLAVGLEEEYGIWGGFDPSERIKIARGEAVREVGQYVQEDSPRRDEVVSLIKEGHSFEEVATRVVTSAGQIRAHLNGYLALRHKQRMGGVASAVA